MRGAVLRGGQMLYRDDIDEPVPGPGQVLVSVKACGICGSDLHFATHGAEMLESMADIEGLPSMSGELSLDRDVFMGHEFCAEILDAGPGTDTHPAGTLVTSVPVLLSATGVDMLVYTNNAVGGYAERMLLSAPLLLAVPNGLDAKHAALTEPMAVGLHAVNMSRIERGQTALVIGCGPIGIAIVAALRLRGVETIVASDFSPARRTLAATMGAHVVVDPSAASPFDGCTPSVIFEAVGAPGVIDDVLRRAPTGSQLVVAGVCMPPDTIHPLYAAAKQISVQFVFGYDPEEFASTLRSLAEGEIDVAPMITGEVQLTGVQQAFADLADPERHCKILVTP